MKSFYVEEYKFLADNENVGCIKDVSLFGAFEENSCIIFKLKFPRSAGVISVNMCFHSDGNDSDVTVIPLRLEYPEVGYETDTFSAILDTAIPDTKFIPGLYYYHYELCLGGSTVCYGGENPMRLCRFSENSGDRQLLIYKSGFSTPEWIRGGIIYHIFVDRFFRSGKCSVKNGAVINEDWENGIPQYADYPGGDVKNNVFFGGDLYGIAEKIDYIASLGTSCIYLSPVFEAASNHKYDTADYMNVDEMFGGNEALEFLVRTAREKGIAVVLDGVFNHTGDDSLYFNKYGSYESVGAYQSEKSPYYSWYEFENYPDEYACWWGVKILPRVDSENENYREFVCGENGVISKWSHTGISGWRLDVADELSDIFLEDLRACVKKNDNDAVIWGEVWEDASNKISYGQRRKYFLGNQIDSVMNYPLRQGIIDYLLTGKTDDILKNTQEIYRRYPKQCSDIQMNLISTHDTWRILTVLSGEGENSRSNAELSVAKLTKNHRAEAIKLVKLAYMIAATIPGVPSIYYGDEAGMEGYHDPFCRKPFPWGKEDKNLLNFYRVLGKLRRSENLYRDGLFRVLRCDNSVFIFERYDKTRSAVTVINRSDGELSLSFDGEVFEGISNKSNVINMSVKGKMGAVFIGEAEYFENIRQMYNSNLI